jgi:predicted alpha/beta superfamily hydrolase
MRRTYGLSALVVGAALTVGRSTQAGTQQPDASPMRVHSAGVVGDLRLHELKSATFGNTRFLRVLVPDGYDLPANRARHYAVLYLADGQNVFDSTTSVFGPHEWRVDETVHQLAARGRIPPMIIVGVDDAGPIARSHEYLPYPDTSNARRDPNYDPNPQGKKYPDFMMKEVMPFINTHYRTLTDPEHTGLGGSSYGGLITAYVVASHPGVFGRALIESPTLSVFEGQVIRDFEPVKKLPARVFLAVGTNEDGDHPNCQPSDPLPTRDGMVIGVQRLTKVLRANGLDSTRLRVVIEPCGRHTAMAWAGRLPTALTFLFGSP